MGFNLFISYASEDDPIAAKLLTTLKNAFGAKIQVFLDKRSIRAGEKIPAALSSSLESADILAVISTGIGKSSHDWGGWEIGYFEAAHRNRLATAGPLWGSMVCFCLDRQPPGPVEEKKYISIGIDAQTLDGSLEEFKEKLGYRDGLPSGIADQDAMLLWFGDIGKGLGEGDIDVKLDLRDRYKGYVAEFKISTFQEVKGRIRKEIEPQKRLLFHYDFGDPRQPAGNLPDNTRMIPSGGAMIVFGLPENETTWRGFREAVSQHPLGNLWCGTLERMVLSAAGAGELDVDNSKLIASNSPANLYRLILASATTYYNNQIDVGVYFVDFYRRIDYGDPTTSLLLKALQLVCRFRFLFLEDLSEFHEVNVRRGNIREFPDLARRIIGELDLLSSDMYVANLQLPATWQQFVSLDKIEHMAAAWAPLEIELRKIYDVVVANRKLCPSLTDPAAVEASREELSKARTDIADKLQEIRNKTLEHNTVLIRSMAMKLLEKIGSHTAIGGAIGQTD